MAKKTNPPSVRETAFDCPHCGAYTTQFWYDIHANSLDKNAFPYIPTKKFMSKILDDKNMPKDLRETLLKQIDRIALGYVSLIEAENSKYSRYEVENLHLSKCYNCGKVAVWVHKSLLFPKKKLGISPNQDLPDDIIHDFNEARAIMSESPRGAAALLRLCVQKLCIHLGKKGKDLNDDIASLVSQGLNPLVQKSLDIVRVIGNEAVHPGVLDLNDDQDIANKLLMLINSIAEQMISHPKNVEGLYNKLPEEKRQAIEKRDKNQVT
jgi:hypothetical protein